MSSRISLPVTLWLICFAFLAFAAGGARAADSSAAPQADASANASKAGTDGKSPDAKSSSGKSGVERLGTANNWAGYTETDKKGATCYLSGKPDKSEPASVKRSGVGVYVTHRPAEKTFNTVNFVTGHPLKNGSEVKLAIDTHQFSLFVSRDTAWSRDAAGDKAIVEAMAKGKQAIVKSQTKEGTLITDTYALAGFAQVLGEIDKACGVKR